MPDPVSEALRASSAHSIWAAPLIFTAGVCTSVGPCVAPRLIAAASLAAGADRRRSFLRLTAFATGLVAAYACLGMAAAFVGHLQYLSTTLYAVLATALGCAGVLSLSRNDRHCTSLHERPAAGVGASLLLGASFVFIASPCCTPLLAGIAAYASASGDAPYGAALMACFALGHTLPLLCTGTGVRKLAAVLAHVHLEHAARTAGAALMLALAGYYAVLA